MRQTSKLRLVGAATFAAIGFGVLGAGAAHADRQDIEVARDDLHQALDDMQQAGDDWGGHKEQAAQYIRQAIDQINQGIDFVNSQSPTAAAPAATAPPQPGIPGS